MPDPPLPPDHYIGLLATGLDRVEGLVAGSTPVRPQLYAAGTRTIRTALLLTMVDLVAGHAPDGPKAPTVDLRIQRLGPTPTTGWIHLRARPLRVGLRLVVCETDVLAGPDGPVFARAVSTFMNTDLDDSGPSGVLPVPPMAEATFDEFLAPRVLPDGRLGVDLTDRIANPWVGTVQGGAQSLLAELAADRLLRTDVPLVATDLEVRYLDKLRVGPLAAEVEPLGGPAGAAMARVRLVDAGAGDRIVSFVSLTLGAAG